MADITLSQLATLNSETFILKQQLVELFLVPVLIKKRAVFDQRGLDVVFVEQRHHPPKQEELRVVLLRVRIRDAEDDSWPATARRPRTHRTGVQPAMSCP